MVCENFDNVVVILNTANTMEVGWIADHPEIKGVIWCPGTGQNGFNGLGEILAGKVNPSGKAADTFVADLTATPTWNTFDAFTYTNMDATRSIYNGGNSCLINQNQTTNYVTDTSATTISHLREAVHGILYVTGNSRAHAEENLQTSTPIWRTILTVVNVVVVLAIVALEVLVVRKGYQKRKGT